MINMRALRKQRKMTMKDLGLAVGVSESTISLYETGKHDPDIDVIIKIADVLGVTLDELFGRSVDQDDDDETFEIRERLRRDPEYRLLFDAAKKATPEHLKTATALLRILEPEDPDVD